MRILLHICCAACAIGPHREMTEQGHSVAGHFYNPNIHPFIEFRRRLKALKVLQERIPIEVIYEEDYGLPAFLEQVPWQAPQGLQRCAGCYRLRFGRVAEEAARRGFDAFSTTLLSSSHQDHALVRRVGEESALAHGVQFWYADWRPLAEEGHRQAKSMRLYLQQYCGCVFSEWERFRETNLHVYRGPGAKDAPDPSSD